MSQTVVNVGVGTFGAVVTYAFGGWSELLIYFLFAMAADYITGVAASLKEKKGLNSEVGFWGLVKKALMLLAVFLAHRADIAFELDNVIMYGALYSFLANEMVSITENYGRLGLPLPNAIKNIIAVLKNRSGESAQLKGGEPQ